MGITKTIECARTSVFWPNMHQDIITHLSSCHPCAEFKIRQKPEPLSHDVPMVVWHNLTLDNFEFKGTRYLLVYDRFSRFIVVKKSDSLSARSTIHLLLEVFTEHGVPSSIRCDRGSNFLSTEFNTFCTDLNIQLSYSSAYHHSLNMAERAVRTIKDLMLRCHSAGVSWRLALIEFCPPQDQMVRPQLNCVVANLKAFCLCSPRSMSIMLIYFQRGRRKKKELLMPRLNNCQFSL